MSGAGILRNVSLVARKGFALEPERVFVRTVSADVKRAELRIEVEGAEIVSPKDGRLVVESPRLWSPEDPFLYDVKVVARGKGGEDSLTVPYGIRTFSFTKDKGFFLNGRHGRDGAKTAHEMRALIRRLDPTRPITAGLNGPQWAEENGVLSALDVCGLNYSPEFYDKFRGKYALVGSETAATYSLRDVYCYRTNGADLVVARHRGNLADAYSMIPVWGVPEQGQELTLKRQLSAPWSAGEFTWCSFDYLGEGSNPLSRGTDHWPCVGSSWGMYDFAGLPKDRAYLYQAMWTEKPMAHLLPDWTLPGCEGKNVPVWCYTNGDEAELFLNGVSQGVRRRARRRSLFRSSLAVWFRGGSLQATSSRNPRHPCVVQNCIVQYCTVERMNMNPFRYGCIVDGENFCARPKGMDWGSDFAWPPARPRSHARQEPWYNFN